MAHQANLRLDDRLEDAESVSTHELAQDIPKTSPVQFKVLFSIDDQPLSSNLSHLWQETEICVIQERDQESNPPSSPSAHGRTGHSSLSSTPGVGETSMDDKSMLSTLPLHIKSNLVTLTKDEIKVKAPSHKGVKFAGSRSLSNVSQLGLEMNASSSNLPKKGVTFAETPSTKNSCQPSNEELAALVKIDDLCLVIQQCTKSIQYNQRCVGYLSHQTNYRLGVYLPPTPPKPPQSPNIASLAQLLSNKQPTQHQLLAPTGNLSLSRGDRLGLALTVASSVLQLHKTPWLREDWDKNDIMIINGYTSNNCQQAYVSRSFSRMKLEDSRPVENQALPLRNVTLFALGKVLIELCLGQALEALRSPEDPVDASGKANLLTDWSTANRLTEAVYSEAGTRYGDAVRRCLHCEFDQRNTNLEDDAFRQAVYDGVVAPLEDDVKAFYDR